MPTWVNLIRNATTDVLHKSIINNFYTSFNEQMSLTTISRGKPPEDWPTDIKKNILLHHGVLNEPSGRIIDVYCPEKRIKCSIDKHTFQSLADNIAKLCGGAERNASFNMGPGHATITAGISTVEIHMEKEGISVRGAREFTGIPDSTWGDTMHFVLIDAYAVINIAAAAEILLEKKGIAIRKSTLSDMLRYGPC